ncbi:MAG: BglII/BstYI family type II restriction endonuclease [Roseivirga sp.]
MKIVYEYSHLGGKQILQIDHAPIYQEIHQVIGSITQIEKTKLSQEKAKSGQMLYSPRELNQAFTQAFNAKGYQELKDRYDIRLPQYEKTIKGSYKQIDFVKDQVLIEVQFGKYAFMFYDMAKFQYFFNENKANVGVEILPCHTLQQQMSSGVAYGEQLVHDIERLKRHFPAVPVYIVLIDI